MIPRPLALLPLALLTSGALAQTGGWISEEQPKFGSSNPQEYLLFGSLIEVDGDTAAVGGRDDVRILLRDPVGGDWSEVATLTAPPNASGFPEAIALSGDTLVVGAPFGLNGVGAACVFERDLGGPEAWGLAATLSASDGLDLDHFGVSVTVSGDTIAVGAELDDHGEFLGSAFGDGSVYVFDRIGGIWTEAQKLIASDAQQSQVVHGDAFGASVSIDGDTLVVGAIPTGPGTGSPEGSAYVFERNGAWAEVAKLTTAPGSQGHFGEALRVSGELVAVGAPEFAGGGAAFLFERAGGSWPLLRSLAASDGASGDRFGSSLSLLGSTLVIGAPRKDAAGVLLAGGAYVFERDQGGPDAWGEVAILEASDGQLFDALGSAVAAMPGGPWVGSPRDGVGIDNIENVEGLAFDPTTGSWYGIDQKLDKLVSIDPLTGFGTLISSFTIAGGSGNLNGLTFDTDSLTLYAMDGKGELLVLDPATGSATAAIPTNVPGLSCLAHNASNGLLYGVQSGLQALVTLDPSTGIGSSPVLGFASIQGLAYDPQAGVLYGCDHASDTLVAIDTVTGVGTAVGPLGFTRVEALAFDAASGTLYGFDNQVRQLITIDTVTGAGTTAAAFAGTPDIVGMAFDPGTGLLWALNDSGNNLVTIDPASGVKTQVGGYGSQLFESLAFDASSGSLYAATVGPPEQLFSVDPATGASTPIGELGFGDVSGLSFDPVSGTLFGADVELQRLITIDTATGAGTPLSEPLGYQSIQGLVYDPDSDLLLATDVASDQLLAIDPATSAITVIGPLGLDDVQGLALDPVGNRLLGANGVSNGNGELVDIDPTTGAATVIGPMSGTLGMGSIYPFELSYVPLIYCTAGTSASGCQAAIAASGTASASAPAGFELTAGGVEGAKSGLFYYGTGGQQASPWGNGTSLQCVAPPLVRTGLLAASGTPGACDGAFTLDLNQVWFQHPSKNPGAGSLVQAQLWYRDPQSTSNQTTSLSDALQLYVTP